MVPNRQRAGRRARGRDLVEMGQVRGSAGGPRDGPSQGRNQPMRVFHFSFIISVLFPNQKLKLNSNSGFNFQISNIKPNSNYSITCTEIIYLLFSILCKYGRKE
jgi:hypothetical protein